MEGYDFASPVALRFPYCPWHFLNSQNVSLLSLSFFYNLLFSRCFLYKVQLIRLSKGAMPALEQWRVRGPNSCTDIVMATPGVEPPTSWVRVMYLRPWATGRPCHQHFLSGPTLIYGPNVSLMTLRSPSWT